MAHTAKHLTYQTNIETRLSAPRPQDEEGNEEEEELAMDSDEADQDERMYAEEGKEEKQEGYEYEIGGESLIAE